MLAQHQHQRQRKPSGMRSTRRTGATALMLAAAALASPPLAAGSTTPGMMVSSIQTQARRPLPPHKLRMLFGEDQNGYRRFLDTAAPPAAAAAAVASSSPPEGDLPLHAGYGTHFAYVYVGTPAQRVSLILDTGSHWTAFPCTGCQQCGDDHTDPVFDVLKSTSYHSLGCSECKFSGHCKDEKCGISLSYAEGSRWDAYEVEDTLYLGGDSKEASILGGKALSMPFVFGCQTYETGLFRTQLENGIMGLSFQDLTIVPKLKEAGKIDATVFSLCFTEDGGSMRLGGYETAHHTAPLQWLPLTKPTGWYTVTLKDIKIGTTSINVDPGQFNQGQGTIVDSGTTDTYLPRGIATAFQRVFKEVSGHEYSSRSMHLSKEEMAALPPLLFVLDNGVEIPMPWHNYMECEGSSCAGAVFLDNGQGAVLGANFMRGNDVVFDLDNQQIGFAPAECTYVERALPAAAAAPPGGGAVPVAVTVQEGGEGGKEGGDVDCELTFGEPVGECSAVCPKEGKGEGGVLEGEQKVEMKISRPASGKGKACPPLPLKEGTKACMVTCAGAGAVAAAGAAAGEAVCKATVTWGPCSAACEQEGKGVIPTCDKVLLTRTCSTGEACPAAQDGMVMDVILLLKGLMYGGEDEEGREEGQGAGEGDLSVGSQMLLLERVSELLLVPGGDLEVLPTGGREGGREEEAAVSVRVHMPRETKEEEKSKLADPFAEVEAEEEAKEGGKEGGLETLPVRAKDINDMVHKPAFAAALLEGLKKEGGAFVALQGVEVEGIHLQDLGPGKEGGGVEGEKDLNLFLWNVVGGAAALFVGLMLLVHLRWTHWQALSETAASSAPGQAAAAAFDRIRQGTESITSVAALNAGGVGAGIGGGGGGGKPSTRVYELVEAGEAGKGRKRVGGAVEEEEDEEEDIEMI